MASLVVLKTERKCHFCKIKENNKLKYGPLYSLSQIVAHYYCVLLSTRMKQNGKDDEGIMGFLLRDINLELRRSKKVGCAYCREKNATVKCAHQGCKKVFHYPCGLESGALSRFRNDFISFCYQHRPKQKIPKKILDEVENTELICAICYETVDPHDRIDSLWAPCCLKTWYHRNCVQKLAQSSGYFFRCATCNDNEKFKSHMEDNGIFVPQQDASWELVPNAYEELLVRHNRCDAVRCKCPKGRHENVENTRWEIILCRFCGSQGIHVGCGDLKFTNPEWECETCQSILKTDSKSKSKGKSKSKSKSKKAEGEYNGDLAVKRPASKSTDSPSTASRKRKLSGQKEAMDKRKKGERSSDDDDKDSNDGNRSEDEFYIRIPGRKSDKPHTATKPDENENENENGNGNGNVNEIENKNENENKSEINNEEEDDEDEDVDVITYDAAWLMVEEVLSKVKPAPLSHKLKLLRKKCFAFHFDPFDVREETPDSSNLAPTDKKNKRATDQPANDSDPDIEIIAEFLVNKKKTPAKPRKNMDVDEAVAGPSGESRMTRAVLYGENFRQLPGPVHPSQIEVFDISDISDDDRTQQELDEILAPLETLDVFPSTSTFGLEPENSTMANPNTMTFAENDEASNHRFNWTLSGNLFDETAEADLSDESNALAEPPRTSNKRPSESNQDYRVKRQRITEDYVKTHQHYLLHSTLYPNLASASEIETSVEPSFFSGLSEEPSAINDQTINSSGVYYGVMISQPQPMLIVAPTIGGLTSGSDPLYTAPTTTSTMVTSAISDSTVSSTRPRVKRVRRNSALANHRRASRTSTLTSWMHHGAIVSSGSLTPSTQPSGIAQPVNPPETDPCPLEMPSDLEAFESDSRVATPLPSLQYFTDMNLSLSPEVSQASNSSPSSRYRTLRFFHHIDVSSDSSNDEFPEGENEGDKQFPPTSAP